MRVEKKKFRTKVSRGFPNHAKEQSFSALCERTEHEAAQETKRERGLGTESQGLRVKD